MMLREKTAEQFKIFLFSYFIYVFVHIILQDCSVNMPKFIYYCVMFYYVVLIL